MNNTSLTLRIMSSFKRIVIATVVYLTIGFFLIAVLAVVPSEYRAFAKQLLIFMIIICYTLFCIVSVIKKSRKRKREMQAADKLLEKHQAIFLR